MSPTTDESETVERVISDQDAETVNGWRRVEPRQDVYDRDGEILVQWENEAGDIGVIVHQDTHDEEPVYTSRARQLTDDVQFSNTSIEIWEDSLETAIDEAISWMRSHRPDVPFPDFTARIEGGIFKPLIDIARRFGGGQMLVEARPDELAFRTSSHVNQVEFEIPRSDMESYDVSQRGEVSISPGEAWDVLKDKRFSDTISLGVDHSGSRVSFEMAGTRVSADNATNYFRRSLSPIEGSDARFTIPGLEFRDKVKATRALDEDGGVFGALDGVVFLHIEGAKDEVTARFEVSELEGEQVVLINPDRLQELRKGVPRPSSTPLTFTLKGNDPMLTEFTVGETDVDVRIALKVGPVPREISFPPEEITVPDDAAPDEGVVEEAAREAADEATTEPEPEPEPEPETTLPAEVGEFDLQEASDTRIYWAVDDGTGVEAAKQDGVWVVWARGEDLFQGTPNRTRLGASQDRDEAAEMALESLRDFLDAREVRQRARSLGGFNRASFKRRTGNDITGGPLNALEAHFDSIEDLENASIEEIESIEGVGPTTIERLQANFPDLDEPEDEDEEQAPPAPPEEEPDLQRATLIVSLIGGSKNYVVRGRVPGAVEDEAVAAARDVLGPPGQFDVNDTVGAVAFRGSEVDSVDLNAGRSTLADMAREEDDEVAEFPEMVGNWARRGGARAEELTYTTNLRSESGINRTAKIRLVKNRDDTFAIVPNRVANTFLDDIPDDIVDERFDTHEAARDRLVGILREVAGVDEEEPEEEKPTLKVSAIGDPEPSLSSVQSEYGLTGREISDRLWDEIEEHYGITEVEELIRVMINPGDEFQTEPQVIGEFDTPTRADEENVITVEEKGREMLATWIQRNIILDFDVAEPLSKVFDDPDEVLPGLREMDDFTEIPGIGPAGAETLRELVSGVEVEDDEPEPVEEPEPEPDPEPEPTAAPDPEATEEMLPLSEDDQRAKAEDENWDTIGPFEAEFESRSAVFYRIPGEGDDSPAMALRYTFGGQEWEAQVSEEGSTNSGRMETVGAGTLADAVAALVDAVPDLTDSEPPAPEPEPEPEPEDFGRTVEATFDDEVVEAAEVEEEPVEEPPEPEPEPEPEPVEQESVTEEDTEGEDVVQLSRGQVETIVEEATLGVSADVKMPGSELEEITMTQLSDTPVEFTPGPDKIVVTAKETQAETVRTAVERWADFTDLDSLTVEQVEDLNDAREALEDQLGVALPALSRPVPVPEGEEDDMDIPLSEEEIEEIVRRAIPGVDPDISFSPDIDSLRIRLERVPGSSIEFDSELAEVQGAVSEPVTAILDALEMWQEAVDLSTVDAQPVNEVREGIADDFGVVLPSVPRVGDEEPGEGDQPAEPGLEGKWAEIKRTAINQEIPIEDREMRVGKRLEDDLIERYPDSFEDLIVGIEFPKEGTPEGASIEDVLTITFGGDLSSDGKRRFATPFIGNIITASGPVSNPKQVWEDFLALVEIFDAQQNGFEDLTDKLVAIDSLSTFRIEEGVFDPATHLLDPEEINEIAARNPDLWQKTLTQMKDVSKAYWAAQRVHSCAAGAETICDIIEQQIAGTNRRGWDDWYLEQAYRVFLDGDWDPKLFVDEWHKVFEAGESERKAEQRRGPVDLDTLGRPGGAAETEATDTAPVEPTQPEPEPEPEPQVDPEPTEEEDTGSAVEDFKDDILDRMD